MGTRWPQLLHDPVHRLIAFEERDCDKLLLRLINTREFQRLRRIKQLGFSETVFPGANIVGLPTVLVFCKWRGYF